jgi:hypothetical protein
MAAEHDMSTVQLWRRMGRPTRHELAAVKPRADELFVAWAAGFFDGEGCISVSRTGRVQILASQTTAAPLIALQTGFGGTVSLHDRPDPRHKAQWKWQGGSAVARNFLPAIRPYLRVKAAQADLAMELLTLHHGRGVKVSLEERAERLRYHAAMAEFNRRGRD